MLLTFKYFFWQLSHFCLSSEHNIDFLYNFFQLQKNIPLAMFGYKTFYLQRSWVRGWSSFSSTLSRVRARILGTSWYKNSLFELVVLCAEMYKNQYTITRKSYFVNEISQVVLHGEVKFQTLVRHMRSLVICLLRLQVGLKAIMLIDRCTSWWKIAFMFELITVKSFCVLMVL